MVGKSHYQFEWDKEKAASNLRKHGVNFRSAVTIFRDVRAVTIFDVDHSNGEERWVTTGYASNGVCLVVVHTWAQIEAVNVMVRIISARKATKAEIRAYEDNL